jgi:hypothetical protein
MESGLALVYNIVTNYLMKVHHLREAGQSQVCIILILLSNLGKMIIGNLPSLEGPQINKILKSFKSLVQANTTFI